MQGDDMFKRCVLGLTLVVASACSIAATPQQEPVDLAMVSRIQAEAFHHSQVMDTMAYLTETIGPRLTNSPQMAAANAWTRKRFKEWGLANVHDEAFPDFGRGWEYTSASVAMLAPRQFQIHALPSAWTPGTNGPVEGDVVQVSIKSPADFDKYKGKLAGKILLLDDERPYKRATELDSRRQDADGLAKLHEFDIPVQSKDRAARIARFAKYMELRNATNKFFADEGVLATLNISSRDDGILRVSGAGSRKAGESAGVPNLVVAAEHYNQLVRAVERHQPVKLRIDVKARFTSDTDQPGYNTIAEIPGQGSLANEVVMLGAHMDSWHTGTGATDNAAGVAVMMEAVRILEAVGAKPRRTIRVALWSGEEEGLIGSRAYVKQHFASYPETKDPEQLKLPEFARKPGGPLQKTREYGRLSAYFNLDNGSGRIRGIYAQENLATVPIFTAWLAPFHDLGATDVVIANTGSTDHISFDRVGLPGFQFIQDDLDYFTHTHHSELDTLDHVEAKDLMQAAAIVASFAYNAAMREQQMPRKPLLQD